MSHQPMLIQPPKSHKRCFGRKILCLPKAPQTTQHIFRLLMPLTPDKTCSGWLPWQRGDQPDPGDAQSILVVAWVAYWVLRASRTCPTLVCGHPPALPRGWFIPVLSKLNSPVLFPRREQQLQALGEEGVRRVRKAKAMRQRGCKWKELPSGLGSMGGMDYGL